LFSRFSNNSKSNDIGKMINPLFKKEA